MYSNQIIKVDFNGAFSSTFKYQGGILSPLLFNIYINSLIDRICKSNIGCKLEILRSNILFYADDMVLLTPSISALRDLLNICIKELKLICLNLNSLKWLCMKFENKKNKSK